MKLWLSNGSQLLGPIACAEQKRHPNDTVTFRVIDPLWVALLGWGKGACVEVQARPMPADRQLPRDVYAYET